MPTFSGHAISILAFISSYLDYFLVQKYFTVSFLFIISLWELFTLVIFLFLQVGCYWRALLSCAFQRRFIFIFMHYYFTCHALRVLLFREASLLLITTRIVDFDEHYLFIFLFGRIFCSCAISIILFSLRRTEAILSQFLFMFQYFHIYILQLFLKASRIDIISLQVKNTLLFLSSYWHGLLTQAAATIAADAFYWYIILFHFLWLHPPGLLPFSFYFLWLFTF